MARDRTMSYFPSRREPVRPAIDYKRHPVFSTRPRWRCEAHRIIFGNLTPAGRLFDLILIGVIVASVVVVMLESVNELRPGSGGGLRALEWVFTALFTVEYAFRLISAEKSTRYARSFFGIVDLLAVLPGFVGLFIPGGQALAVIRLLRVLRVFRVLKLAQFVGGERLLIRALRSSAYKIAVFVVAVLVVVTVVGAAMYVIEGAESGFSSIPRGVYWAIVTVTTVGFGDITPQTTAGQMTGCPPHDPGVRRDRRADGDRDRRNDGRAREPPGGPRARVSPLRLTGPRCRRRPLQALRRRTP
ncbi:ion transporter [Candidatus Palauibacter sp.]|uniref:ion transporter n=1 Tax=Candidatus Palauibacter sp. TaxID=3101350 RepID=UPI003AF2B349